MQILHKNEKIYKLLFIKINMDLKNVKKDKEYITQGDVRKMIKDVGIIIFLLIITIILILI